MGPIGVPEMLFILAVALLIFGPKRLPEFGRTIGKALGEFRRATSDLKRSIDVEMMSESVKPSTPARPAVPREAASGAAGAGAGGAAARDDADRPVAKAGADNEVAGESSGDSAGESAGPADGAGRSGSGVGDESAEPPTESGGEASRTAARERAAGTHET